MAAELPSLDELMSPSEMEITGVDKLSAEEKQALREWLEVFVDLDAKFAAKRYAERKKAEEKAGVTRQKSEPRTEQVSETTQHDVQEKQNRFSKSQARIVGDFTGWKGKTTFRLDNGEVWQQRKPDSIRRTKRVSNPEVRITRNFMGFYIMEVPAVKTKVPVTRIK